MQIDEKLWEDIIRFWMFPRVAEPAIHDTIETAQKQIGDEIAGFNFLNHRIDVSMPLLEEEVGKEFLDIVLKHEVGHYALAPYSMGMMFLLSFEAMEALRNSEDEKPKKQKAQIVQNLFTDIVVNTYIAMNDKKGKDEIIELYRRLSGNKTENQDDLWKLYMRTYEKLFNVPAGTIVDKTSKGIETDAESIKNLISAELCDSGKWRKKIRKFAYIVKDYLPEDTGRIGFVMIDNPDLEKELRKMGYRPGQSEEDIPESVKKAMKQIAGSLDKDDFKKLAAGFGIGNPFFANKLIYEAMAAGYSICLPEVMTQAGELYPDSPQVWEPSDDPDALDTAHSLGEAGILVPGVTTQKWKYREGVSWTPSKEPVDLAIMLDTSGSMMDPDECISYAHLSAMVVADSALNTGNSVALINFSERNRVTPYTRDRTVLHNEIMHYFGGGTTFPTTELTGLVKSNNRKQHLFIITDTGFSNEDEAVEYLEKAINLAGGGGTLFLAYSDENSVVNHLKKIAYNVHPMSDKRDLLELTRKTAQELYA